MPFHVIQPITGYIALSDGLAAKVKIDEHYVIDTGIKIIDVNYARHTCLRCEVESIYDTQDSSEVDSARLIVDTEVITPDYDEPSSRQKVIDCIPGSKIYETLHFYKSYEAIYWYNFVVSDDYTGEALYYNLDGSLFSRVQFKEGKRNGLSIKYQLSGDTQVIISEETPYIDNIVEGTKKSYYSNGVLYYIRDYKQGVRDGVSIEYDTQGRCINYCIFREGKKNGREELYREDATLKSVHNNVDGLKEGDQFYYKPDGKTLQCHAIFTKNEFKDIVKGYLNTSDY